jgi:hypothetical protein
MTLSISIFKSDPASGENGPPRLIEGAGGLAGVELTRTTLWGSRAVASLGGRYLPRLAHEDLWIAPAELDDFALECTHLLENAGALAAETQWDESYIVRCLQNFVAAVACAKTEEGGIVID